MQGLIDSGEAGLTEARNLFNDGPASAFRTLRDLRLLAPLPVPTQVRDFMGFEAHVLAAGESFRRLRAAAVRDQQTVTAGDAVPGPLRIPPVWYQQPLYYKCNRFAVAGTGTDVAWPAYSRVMDYELEFAVVVGRGGHDIPKEQARDHIFGYTIYNDFTARDAQGREMAGLLGPAKGKDFDGGTILGPCIVTRDELTDPYNLSMKAWVNGELWSDGHSSTMHWTFEQMIEHVSQGETLYPGEILASGTVGGGCGLEQMRFLKHGDVVELAVEHIGTLRNRIVAPHTLNG
jgi:2-keto-4-pentenoate hydratase/2-oxohepta-3-ene-1,7-dioic acid hydratase in catechol pathway